MTSKVLIVDDSAFMRNELQRILNEDPRLQVIATAEDGEEAVRMVKALKPDVVTMDINMPVMDGITSLKRIMNEAPCPIVMVSALTHEAADETIEALAAGAFDFFHKPSGSISLDISLHAEIIREKVRTAALSKRQGGAKKKSWKNVVRSTPLTVKPRRMITIPDQSGLTRLGQIVAIGVSTGGPKTLMAMLPAIPVGFKGAIVIAQHMPEHFTLAFAKRLDGICPLSVKEAAQGDLLQNGNIYLAPGGKHMKIVTHEHCFSIEIADKPASSIFVPSVEVLFRSLLENAGDQWLGVMLTGMGSDGASALCDLRKLGGHTIVEAEESCVVFGMPRKVIEMDGAEFILPEQQIAAKIIELIENSECH